MVDCIQVEKRGYTHSLSPSSVAGLRTLTHGKACRVQNKRLAGRGPCELIYAAGIAPLHAPHHN